MNLSLRFSNTTGLFQRIQLIILSLLLYFQMIYKYFIFLKYISLHIFYNLSIIFVVNIQYEDIFDIYLKSLSLSFTFLLLGFFSSFTISGLSLGKLCLTTLILIIWFFRSHWTEPPYPYWKTLHRNPLPLPWYFLF